MKLARELMHAAGGKSLLMAKIERAEAIPVLGEIIDASDAIMVARGDLSVEVGDAAVPGLQKKMIKMARARNKLVITATQMMESMITNPIPTRAEVSDVANAVLDGTDAVMLSAETAVGDYPVETIEAMARICINAEKETEESCSRPPSESQQVYAHRPIHRHVRVVCGLAFQGEGHRCADAIRFDRVVDVAHQCRYADLCDDADGSDPEQSHIVQRRASYRFQDRLARITP